VKVGAPVELKFTSLDKTHGFKINSYPDGSDSKVNPGLFSIRKKTASNSKREPPP
jgi:heme/copper-type cytochrome/quinol oxidase subunit 2